MSMTAVLLPLAPLLATLAAAAPVVAPGTPAGPAAPAGTGVPPPWYVGLIQFAPFILLIAVFFYFSYSQQRKQRREREALLASVGRGDTVKMVGGEIGKIVEVDADGDTVLLKVDETNNTKIRYGRDAVATVLESKNKPADGKPADAAAAKNPKAVEAGAAT